MAFKHGFKKKQQMYAECAIELVISYLINHCQCKFQVLFKNSPCYIKT